MAAIRHGVADRLSAGPEREVLMERKAKIVATIGPASQDEAVLEKLIGRA